jgi:hypothetical protein
MPRNDPEFCFLEILAGISNTMGRVFFLFFSLFHHFLQVTGEFDLFHFPNPPRLGFISPFCPHDPSLRYCEL